MPPLPGRPWRSNPIWSGSQSAWSWSTICSPTLTRPWTGELRPARPSLTWIPARLPAECFPAPLCLLAEQLITLTGGQQIKFALELAPALEPFCPQSPRADRGQHRTPRLADVATVGEPALVRQLLDLDEGL